jgi:hypothetical protein
MKDVGALLLASALALAVVAGVVIAGRDTTTFVPPPESVAEDFTRKLAMGRYEVAPAHLDEHTPDISAAVRRSSDMLREQAGRVHQVAGESGAIRGDTATASVTIETRDAGELRWEFSLVRRNGEWKIREWRARQDSNLWPSAPEADALSS